jgi:hypothetical protein
MELLKPTLTKKSLILLLVGILLLSILFETFQQYYYVLKFELTTDVQLLGLLKNQFYRWIVWSFLAIPILWYTQKVDFSKNSNSIVFRYALLITVLVALDILLISVIAFILSGYDFSLNVFLTDFLVFFTFQKAPLFTLGYIAVSIIFYLYKENNQLSVQVSSLGDLKKINEHLYDQLRTANRDQTEILTIKIGNKYKAVPVELISFIAADDYCVKIYTQDQKNYTMRISLNALEEKLPNHFLRIHRKNIINLRKLMEFDAHKRMVILEDAIELPVSKNRLKDLRSHLATSPVTFPAN